MAALEKSLAVGWCLLALGCGPDDLRSRAARDLSEATGVSLTSDDVMVWTETSRIPTGHYALAHSGLTTHDLGPFVVYFVAADQTTRVLDLTTWFDHLAGEGVDLSFEEWCREALHLHHRLKGEDRGGIILDRGSNVDTLRSLIRNEQVDSLLALSTTIEPVDDQGDSMLRFWAIDVGRVVQYECRRSPVGVVELSEVNSLDDVGLFSR